MTYPRSPYNFSLKFDLLWMSGQTVLYILEGWNFSIREIFMAIWPRRIYTEQEISNDDSHNSFNLATVSTLMKAESLGLLHQHVFFSFSALKKFLIEFQVFGYTWQLHSFGEDISCQPNTLPQERGKSNSRELGLFKQRAISGCGMHRAASRQSATELLCQAH